ncbi:unnamed protein product, partial [Ixodes hexagonus]
AGEAREVVTLCTDAPRLARAERQSMSTLRVYGHPATDLSNPAIFVTSWSSFCTLPWSPSKSCRKLAWVPVVPLTPRKRSLSRARSRFSKSISRSWTQRQARFPTVVSCAG